jgi:pyruvate dehydrogenase E1 component beta subunit
MRELKFFEALDEAQFQAVKLSKSVFIYGLGVNKTTKVFKTCVSVSKKFPNNIFDTPAAEQALTSFGAGAANAGLRPVLIHQRIDFMIYTLDQIINWISLWHFKSNGKKNMPIVIRAIIGKGWGQGPQHAKSLLSTFSYVPGLNVVCPSSPSEAKGMLLSSIFSNDPTIFLEYRELYNTKDEVPKKPYFIDFRKPRVRTKGSDLTIVAIGPAVLKSLRAIEICKNKSIELIDLRSLRNYDENVIFKSVRKTKRLLIVEDGWKDYGVGAEIIAKVSDYKIKLKNFPKRISWPSSHIPMSMNLEKKYYFDVKEITKAIKNIFNAR